MAVRERLVSIVVGAAVVILLAGGVAAALVVDDDDAGSSPPPAPAGDNAPPSTPAPGVTAPPGTLPPAPVSRAEATRALCADIVTSIQAVIEGRVVAGGLRLSRAVNTYGDEADAAVVGAARRMLSTAVEGDLEASAAAADQAGAACDRLGYPVPVPLPDDPGGPSGPGGRRCVTTPC